MSILSEGSPIYRSPDRMVLDSGTASHLTASVNRVRKLKLPNLIITLADDCPIQATEKGIRTFNLVKDEGSQKTNLSNALVVPNLEISLPYIPPLLGENIAVLFVSKKAVIIDEEDNNSIQDYVKQYSGGIFYIFVK